MSERQALLATLAQLPVDDEVVLATVVKVEGSAYRRPGARMLIPRVGRSVGTLSGGCLESEVSKKAWWLTEGGLTVLRRYSTASLDNESESTDEEPLDEETELQFGLGCNGTVHILFQRLSVSAPLFARLRKVEEQGQAAAQALVIESRGSKSLMTGDCFDEADIQTKEPALAALLQAQMQEVCSSRRSRLLQLQDEQGRAELLLEYLAPNPELIIVGAGHDAEPLVQMAAAMGWRVTVIDGRRHFARPERFPLARQVLCLQADDPASAHLPGDAAVVIMSHSFAQDRAWLRHFLSRSPPYLGQLGPKSRTDRLLGEFADSADPAIKQAIAALHAPVGLDLGGSTPEAVALAILAEAQAALNGRVGGSLKQRQQPIHMAEPVVSLPWPQSAEACQC
ncbi:XdhC family protein [Permianibacter aggregans]|uniref:Xanthine/CO dehydrogenase XdhC/CoxF family maturation factor n=1 Tax=Permianibacter aggregans TaxID=1510150 RepID=A0A4V3D7A1_9GAMM|nr:XdhC/CoxI family protein [Permianibacter aggregans]QGX39742.1 XdhC/CoxI family protein [Permianibacter aggregans]TDQ47137.1 xanthine/CO dehydrogenase XdhC/CoxF family maturation factor [Permianibacter aggregans]